MATTSKQRGTPIGNGIRITSKHDRTTGVSGTWVTARRGAYHISALVFPEHALDEDWEVRDSAGQLSRISKLCITQARDRQPPLMAYNWDRGADVSATNDEIQGVVDTLCRELAPFVFGQ